MSWKDLTKAAISACLNAFGNSETVEYKAAAVGWWVEIRGIFDRNYIEVDPDTGAEVTTNQPMIGVLLEELPNGRAEEGDQVRINGTEVFDVWDSQEDGQGAATLLTHHQLLQRQFIQRFADRAGADAQGFRELGLGRQQAARGPEAFGDSIPQNLLDLQIERVGA